MPTAEKLSKDVRLHEGRVVLITGAAIGNGRAFAIEFARTGAQVVVADITDATATMQAIRDVNPSHPPYYVQVDVTQESSTRAMVTEVLQQYGRIDILINNAGIYDEEPFELLTLEAWRNVMEVNLTGLFLTTQAVIPCMKEQGGGRIINLSSDTIWLGTPYLVHYVTSKMGVVGFTRALASEVGKYGITVNAITIGLTATQRPAGTRLNQGNILKHLLPPQSIERPETPEDIAKVVSFLASDASAIITGQTLNVDGGVARH